MVPRTALIGLAGYGRTHTRYLLEQAQAGSCTLASAVSLPGTPAEAEAPWRAAGARIHRSFEAWLEAEQGQADLVCVPAPIHLHRQLALGALQAGGSVLVEKPMAAGAEDIRALVRGAAHLPAGRFLGVAFQDLWLPENLELQADLVRGRWGRVRSVSVLGLWPRFDAYYARTGWAGRLRADDGSPVLDSPLNNAVAHGVMFGLFLAGSGVGRPATVLEGEAEVYRARPIESFDTVSLRARTSTGVTLFCHLTHSGSQEHPVLVRVRTDSAVLEWRQWHSLRIEPADGPAVESPRPTVEATCRHQFAAAVRAASGAPEPVVRPSVAAAHATLVVDLHAAVPIVPVDGSWLEASSEARGTITRIVGIDEVLLHALREEALPSELGSPWAARPTAFPGSLSAEAEGWLDGIPPSR